MTILAFLALASPLAAAPSITSAGPSPVDANTVGFTLSVAGSGFVQGSVVSWAGRPLATTWLSPVLLNAAVPTELLAISGKYPVVVTNPDATVSNPYGAIVRPVLERIAQAILGVGSPDTTVTATGIGFRPATGLALDAPGGRVLLTTTYVSPTSLTAVVPASALTSVRVLSIYTLDATDGFSSLPLPLYVARPDINMVVPSSATAGGPAFILRVYGGIFVPSSVVRWNGSPLSTDYWMSSTLYATVPASLIATPGTATITVATGSATSNGVSFPITPGLVPAITQISPSGVTAGSPGLTLTVAGSNFGSGSVVQWNSAPLATTYVSSTQLTASLPASLIAGPGGSSITVVNSGGGLSNAVPFSIAPVRPTISSLSPTSAPAGTSAQYFMLTVNGTGFVSGQTSVEWNGIGVAVTVTRPTQLIASVPGYLLATPGTANITVSILGVYSAPMTFTVTPGAPVIQAWVPSSATAGGPAFTLTVLGNHFVSASAVQWNGSPLATTFVSATQLVASVPASLIAAPGTAGVTVLNPGGAVSSPVQLSIAAPVPQISSLTPPSAAPGGAAFTLAVSGSGFLSGATLMWNGSPLPTMYLSPADLSAAVPASLIAAPGSARISVVNPGGAASTAVTFTISGVPAIVGFSPLPAAGGPAFTATLVGSNFAAGAVVQWNGTALHTTFVSSTLLTATVPAALIANPGAASITVQQGTAVSLPFPITVMSPSPAISSVNPTTAVAGGAAFTLTVTGAGFDRASVVAWNGSALPTSFGDSTRLTAPVPAGLIAAPGKASITVQNANAAVSSPFWFTISAPVPVISALSPASASAGGSPFTLGVAGTGFLSGTVVYWNGSPLTTEFVTATRLTAAVSADLIARPGSATVTIVGPTGSASLAVSFAIHPAIPVISTLSPSSATAGGAAFTLTVDGSGFLSGAAIRWNDSPLSTTFVSATQLTASVPGNLIAATGSVRISVVNPTGPPSAPVLLPITAASPAIAGFSPASATAGSPALTLTVNGSGFLSGAAVQWNGSPLATSFASYSQVIAEVPAALLNAAADARITVINPGGEASSAVSFRINAAAPAISGANPDWMSAGAAAFTLTVTGAGFLPGATVQWNGSPLATTFVDPTQLSAQVPAARVANSGTAAISVANPGGTASAAIAFPIVALTVGGFAPSSVSAGSPAFALSIVGTGFLSGAAAYWNGSPLPTTFTSSETLVAAVAASLVATAGAARIAVSNPGGALSNTRDFVISSAGASPVAISIGRIANAASGQPLIAPGSLISIYGANLASETSYGTTSPLPTSLSGTTVTINGARIPLLFAGPLQINAQVPFETPAGVSTLLVQVKGVSSGPASFDVWPAAPGVFTIAASNHALAVNASDWSLNSALNPAKPGQFLVLYLTGQGLVNSPVATGAMAPASPASVPLAAVQAKIGGQPATVSFAGLAPGWVGLLQLNVLVPAAEPGEQPLEITIGGVTANPTAVSVGPN